MWLIKNLFFVVVLILKFILRLFSTSYFHVYYEVIQQKIISSGCKKINFLQKADIAIASLTVTSSREEVVQFTKPYMELQHSYVRQRQTLLKLDYFQHLKPFTTTVWLIILFGAIFAGLVLYAVDYFSPFGWRQVVKGKTGDDGTEFNASNSIWFTFASSLLQGGDNTPRTLSGLFSHLCRIYAAFVANL